VGSGTHEDHGSTLGVFGVLRELASNAFGGIGRYAGDRFLPGGRINRLGIVISAGPLARQAGPSDAVLSEHEVEDRCDQMPVYPSSRHPARRNSHISLARVKARHIDGYAFVGAVYEREQRIDLTEFKIP